MTARLVAHRFVFASALAASALSTTSLTNPVLAVPSAHNITQDESYPTIQAAIDAAQSGDEIVLSPDVYRGPGNRDVDTQGKSLTIRGIDPDNPFTVASTVIDCEGNGFNRQRAFRMESAEPFAVTLRGLTIRNGSAPLEVFNTEIAPAGGAIYCVGGSLNLDACVLENNSALTQTDGSGTRMNCYGGAVYVIGPAFSFTRCSLLSNQAAQGPDYPWRNSHGQACGGAVYADITEPMLIEDCLISGNSLTPGWPTGFGYGGGVYCRGSGTITRCRFLSNSAYSSNDPSFGGATYVVGAVEFFDCDVIGNGAGSGNSIAPGIGGISGKWVKNCRILNNSNGGVAASRLTNCIIAGNDLTSEGGPVGAGVRSAGIVENCLILGNSASTGGGLANAKEVRNCTIVGNYAGKGSALYDCGRVINCIIWNNKHDYDYGQLYNTSDVSYSCIENGYTGLLNVSNDPRFRVYCTGTWTAAPLCAQQHNTYCFKTTLQDATQNWTPNSLVGKWLTTKASYTPGCVIISNTPTTMLVQGDLTSLAVGSAYRIYDFSVKSCSPCVDAGDGGLDYSGQTDIDGDPRVILSRVDIGADEFNPATIGPVPDTPADAVASPGSVCPGGCATLSANFCDGGDVLEWFANSPNGQLVPGGSNPVVCPDVTTTYFVRARNTSTGETSGFTSTAMTVRTPGLWQAMNPGFDGKVNALATYRGEMIVGGEFKHANGVEASAVAAWDGSTWHQVGAGLQHTDPRWPPYVASLALYHDELIAIGYFNKAGDIAVSGVAAWNGSYWRPMGTGPGFGVTAAAAYRDQLIAVGSTGPFPRTWIWDGSTWTTFVNTLDRLPSALTVYQDKLIMAGSFTKIDELAVNRIAAWNGSQWRPLGTGTNGSVSKLLVYQNKLIATGSFTTADDLPASGIAAWDGTSWTAMSNELASPSVAIYRNELIAVGTAQDPDGVNTRVIARWTGNAWDIMAPANAFPLAEYGGELYALTSAAGGLMSWGCWPMRIIGDLDGDLRVDGQDLLWLEACGSGPAVPYRTSPECPFIADDGDVLPADLDGDGDVDADDFAVFQRCQAADIATINPECVRTRYW